LEEASSVKQEKSMVEPSNSTLPPDRRRDFLYKQSQFPPDQKRGQRLGGRGVMVNRTFDRPRQNKAN
jgi:hypothetical protein